MTQGQKRELRVRKPPNYLNSDEEDADAVMKIRTTYKKDAKQNAQQTNAMAKLLVKFINQANTYYRQCQKDLKTSKNDKPKKNQNTGIKQPPKGQVTTDNTRRSGPVDQGRTPKQSKGTKTYNPPSRDGSKNVMGMYPTQANEGVNTNVMSFLAGIQGNQQMKHFNQWNELYPGLKQYIATHQQLLRANIPLPPSLIQNGMFPGGQTNMNPDSRMRSNISAGTRPIQTTQKNTHDGAKLFKRASYHVAIAYHIYFKQLEANNSDTDVSNVLDPTYFAKKLRQEKNKETQGQPGRSDNPVKEEQPIKNQ